MAVQEETKQRTPLTGLAKVVIFIAGYSNFWLGYALYFVMYDTDLEKAKYFRYGARTSLIISVLAAIVGVIIGILGISNPEILEILDYISGLE